MKRDGSYLCDKNSKMKTRQIDSDKIFFQMCMNSNHIRRYVRQKPDHLKTMIVETRRWMSLLIYVVGEKKGVNLKELFFDE